jgi:hypothetical protein
VFLREHPTARRNEVIVEEFIAVDDVTRGPLNLLVHAGVDLELTRAVRARGRASERDERSWAVRSRHRRRADQPGRSVTRWFRDQDIVDESEVTRARAPRSWSRTDPLMPHFASPSMVRGRLRNSPRAEGDKDRSGWCA